LCSELNRWYKYVKENKGDKKDTCQFALVLAKNLLVFVCASRGQLHKPPTKVKRTNEEM